MALGMIKQQNHQQTPKKKNPILFYYFKNVFLIQNVKL